MVVFTDLQCQPDQCQVCLSLKEGIHHLQLQEAPNMDNIMHKNDPQAKPDLMVVFSDLQRHPDQHQACPLLEGGSHHPQPQEAPNMDMICIK